MTEGAPRRGDEAGAGSAVAAVLRRPSTAEWLPGPTEPDETGLRCGRASRRVSVGAGNDGGTAADAVGAVVAGRALQAAGAAVERAGLDVGLAAVGGVAVAVREAGGAGQVTAAAGAGSGGVVGAARLAALPAVRDVIGEVRFATVRRVAIAVPVAAQAQDVAQVEFAVPPSDLQRTARVRNKRLQWYWKQATTRRERTGGRASPPARKQGYPAGGSVSLKATLPAGEAAIFPPRPEMNGSKLQIRLWVLLAVVAVAVCGCQRRPWIIGYPPPPPPPRPAPVAVRKPAPPPAPPAPPPKTCKSLDEKCEAKADTELVIGDNAAKFHPPPGWIYAKESRGPVAADPGSTAMMALGTAKTAWPRDTAGAIDQLLDRLDITMLARKAFKTRLPHAQTKVDADGLEIELWEVNKARQFGHPPEMDGKPSSVLVIVAKLPAGNAVVGVASVLKPGGDSQVPAIMKAVKTLKSAK